MSKRSRTIATGRRVQLLFIAACHLFAVSHSLYARAVPKQPSVVPSTHWIYYNGQFNWHDDSVSATANYQSTAGSPLSGSQDIVITDTPSGAWQALAPSEFSLTAFTGLTIALKPTAANQTWTCHFTTTPGNQVGNAVNVLSYGPAPVIGQWGVYTIPFAALGVTGASISTLVIQDGTGLASNTWYIDNVGFVPVTLVPFPPIVNISVNPTSVTSGSGATLTWSSSNATSCTASGGGTGWSGSQPLAGSTSVSPALTTAYTLTCTNTGGATQATATLTVSPNPSSVPYWAYVDGNSKIGADWSWSTTPNYSSTAGSPLSGAYDIQIVGTQWAGWQPYFGTLSLSPYSSLTMALKPTVANQTWSVSATAAGAPSSGPTLNMANYGPAPVAGQWGIYTIPLSALGMSGATLQSFAVQDQTGLTSNTWYVDNVGFLPAGVNAGSLPPTVTLSSNPIIIQPGVPSTLTWSSTNATSCVMNGGWNSSVATVGSAAVTPSTTTGYTITCSSPDGSASASAGVTVTNPGAFSIQIAGNKFINSSGTAIQLRGANLSGMEFTAIDGYDPSDPTGGNFGQPNNPKWSALQAWRINIVRIPLNEDSWLGLTCTDTGGVVHQADPGNNYKQALANLVQEANQAGMYVILDLHWAAPGSSCPMLQSQMADADHSLAFWTSIANTYKYNQAVMFELFNEPFLDFDFTGDPWQYMMFGTGGSFSGYPASGNSGVWENVENPWNIASYQAMISAIRATGAMNPVLIGSVGYTSDLSGWLSHKPNDPLNQMAATWHAYPTYGAAFGSAAYAQPNNSPQIFTEVLGIQAAGIPVIITETGDQDTAGTVGAPLVSTVTAFADANGLSVLGWTWDVWGNPDDVLIKDVNGTPTDGYGQFFQSWLVNHP